MTDFKVDIIDIEEKAIYGLWKQANDKTISNDINTLSEDYYRAISISKGGVLPYIVLSKNYDEVSQNFELFIGSILKNDKLESVILPAGKYAKISVKPKFGFIWGASIGEAKRYFYTRWLLNSQYQSLNMEYELHTLKSKSKHPTIDIIFAIKTKI